MSKYAISTHAIAFVAFVELCLHMASSIFALVAFIATWVCISAAFSTGDPWQAGLALIALSVGAVLCKAASYFFHETLTGFAKRLLQRQNLSLG